MNYKLPIAILLLLLLFALNVIVGAVHIPLADVAAIILGRDVSNASWSFIVLQSRLPQAITAMLSGAALATGGQLLQTAFRNPLADPTMFGISSGAGLGAAVAMLALGGTMGVGAYSVTGFMAIVLAAAIGAVAVTALIVAASTVVRSSAMLLIVGLMVGYLASSAISLLNFFATDEGVKTYLVWGLGSFGGVSMRQLPLFAATVVLALGVAMTMAKPLNALQLGERYAANLGVRVHTVRHTLLATAGLLTAVVTAFCGPVAFVGLAVPHMARLLAPHADHRTLLPATIIMGAIVALACNLLCTLPTQGQTLPLNAVTPLFGVPIVAYIIMRKS